MYQKRYKISIVNYLNTLPFVYGLQQSGIDQKLDISYDIPAVCAEKLLTRQVDIGLVPVAILAKIPEYHILTDFCIGSNGQVDSVKLFSHVPLNQITEILLDYQSRTSVALAQLLAKELWKIQPVFTPAKAGFEDEISGPRAAVIIGDRTFPINNTFPYEYDLATEWKKLTGLSFTFAAWASHSPVDDPLFLEEFNRALAFGVDHTREALQNYTNAVPRFDPYDYLVHKISYRLDAPKKQAITKFLDFLKNL
jgi:chorismate dehydratase